jgi:hypothetical protein
MEVNMDQRRRSSLTGGLFLILLGAWFLAMKIFPGLDVWVNARVSWPLFVIGAGVLLLALGLLTGVPDMAVPAAIVSGIGGLLLWQNATGRWESWAYAWTLIPGFVGVGVLVSGLLGRHPRQSLREGINLIVISAVLFFIFGAFLGGPNLLGSYWPVLLIFLGLWLLVSTLLRR